jgi:hypothetical protein
MLTISLLLLELQDASAISIKETQADFSRTVQLSIQKRRRIQKHTGSWKQRVAIKADTPYEPGA